MTSLRNAVKQITGAQRLKAEVMEFINASITTQHDLVNKKAPINTWEDVVKGFPNSQTPLGTSNGFSSPFSAQESRVGATASRDKLRRG